MYLMILQESLKDVELRARDRRAHTGHRCVGTRPFQEVHLHMEFSEESSAVDAVLGYFLEELAESLEFREFPEESGVMDSVMDFSLEFSLEDVAESLKLFLEEVVEVLQPRCLLAILRPGHRRRAEGPRCGTTPRFSRRNSHRNLEISMMAGPKEENPGKS